MVGSSLLLYSILTTNPAIPARTEEAKIIIAQNYGEGAAHLGLNTFIGTAAIRPPDWTNSFDSVWNFEDSPGITADSGTVGDTLTNNGSITTISDSSIQGSKVADLAGDGTQWFSLPDGGNTDKSGDAVAFTTGCWVNWDTDGSVNEIIIGKHVAANQDSGYALYNRSTGTIIPRAGAYNVNTATFTTTTGPGSGICTAPTCDYTARWGDPNVVCSAHADCVYWSTGTWTQYGLIVRGSTTNNGFPKYWASGNSGVPTTANFDLAGNSEDFKIGYSDSNQDIDAKIDECFFDSAELTNEEFCRICSLGIAGQRGECDPTTPANYKPCNSNSDCVDNNCVTIAVEDNCSPGGSAGCCMGYNDWPRFGLNCNDCDLPACNATRS